MVRLRFQGIDQPARENRAGMGGYVEEGNGLAWVPDDEVYGCIEPFRFCSGRRVH